METATRYSPKREAILQCLRSTTCHPSAEWVYAQLKPHIPDLSLATVYRNLARFRSEGAVQVIGCVDGEDRYDGNTAPPRALHLPHLRRGDRPAPHSRGHPGSAADRTGRRLQRHFLRLLQRMLPLPEKQLTTAGSALRRTPRQIHNTTQW